MKKIILFFILAVLSVLFFTKLQDIALKLNFSWTISYLLPYIMLVSLGGLLAFSMRRKLRLALFLRGFISLLILALPFSIGFVLHPMYEGDLAKEGKAVQTGNRLKDFKAMDLVIITIPGCPFCKQSVERMNILQKRNPELKIKYIVCSSMAETLNELKPGLDPAIQISLATDSKHMFELTSGKFPCFVKVKKNQAVHKWTNNQLGTRALDWIESGQF